LIRGEKNCTEEKIFLFMSQLQTFKIKGLKVLFAERNSTRERERVKEKKRRQGEVIKTICYFIIRMMIVLFLLSYMKFR